MNPLGGIPYYNNVPLQPPGYVPPGMQYYKYYNNNMEAQGPETGHVNPYLQYPQPPGGLVPGYSNPSPFPPAAQSKFQTGYVSAPPVFQGNIGSPPSGYVGSQHLFQNNTGGPAAGYVSGQQPFQSNNRGSSSGYTSAQQPLQSDVPRCASTPGGFCYVASPPQRGTISQKFIGSNPTPKVGVSFTDLDFPKLETPGTDKIRRKSESQTLEDRFRAKASQYGIDICTKAEKILQSTTPMASEDLPADLTNHYVEDNETPNIDMFQKKASTHGILIQCPNSQINLTEEDTCTSLKKSVKISSNFEVGTEKETSDNHRTSNKDNKVFPVSVSGNVGISKAELYLHGFVSNSGENSDKSDSVELGILKNQILHVLSQKTTLDLECLAKNNGSEDSSLSEVLETISTQNQDCIRDRVNAQTIDSFAKTLLSMVLSQVTEEIARKDARSTTDESVKGSLYTWVKGQEKKEEPPDPLFRECSAEDGGGKLEITNPGSETDDRGATSMCLKIDSPKDVEENVGHDTKLETAKEDKEGIGQQSKSDSFDEDNNGLTEKSETESVEDLTDTNPGTELLDYSSLRSLNSEADENQGELLLEQSEDKSVEKETNDEMEAKSSEVQIMKNDENADDKSKKSDVFFTFPKETKLNPGCAEFVPSPKHVLSNSELVSSQLNPNSPVFHPQPVDVVQSNNYSTAHENSMVRPNASVFQPSLHIRPHSKPVKMSKNSSCQTETAVLVDTAMNTRRTKQANQSTETVSCDKREVCVNTMETFEIEDSDNTIPMVKKVSKGTLTVGQTCKSVGIMAAPPMCNQSTATERSLDTHAKLLKTQRELLQLRARVCLDEIKGQLEHLKKYKHMWLDIFSTLNNRTIAEDVIDSKISALKMKRRIIPEQVALLESMLDDGEFLQTVPRFSIADISLNAVDLFSDDEQAVCDMDSQLTPSTTVHHKIPVNNRSISTNSDNRSKINDSNNPSHCTKNIRSPESLLSGNKTNIHPSKRLDKIIEETSVSDLSEAEHDNRTLSTEACNLAGQSDADDINSTINRSTLVPIYETCEEEAIEDDKSVHVPQIMATEEMKEEKGETKVLDSEVTVDDIPQNSQSSRVTIVDSHTEYSSTADVIYPTTKTCNDENNDQLLNDIGQRSSASTEVKLTASDSLHLGKNSESLSQESRSQESQSHKSLSQENQNIEAKESKTVPVNKVSSLTSNPSPAEEQVSSNDVIQRSKSSDTTVSSGSDLSTSSVAPQESNHGQSNAPSNHEISNAQGVHGNLAGQAVDPKLYEAVLAQIKNVYPQIASDPNMLNAVAIEQTLILQWFVTNGNPDPNSVNMAAVMGTMGFPQGLTTNAQLPIAGTGDCSNSMNSKTTNTTQVDTLPGSPSQRKESLKLDCQKDVLDQSPNRPPGFPVSKDELPSQTVNSVPVKECEMSQGKLTCEMPKSKLTCEILQGKSTCEILQGKSTCEMPQIMSTCEMPQIMSTSEMPQIMSTCELPQSKLTYEMPQNKLACEMPQNKLTCEMPQNKSACEIPQNKSECEMPTVMNDEPLNQARIPYQVSQVPSGQNILFAKTNQKKKTTFTEKQNETEQLSFLERHFRCSPKRNSQPSDKISKNTAAPELLSKPSEIHYEDQLVSLQGSHDSKASSSASSRDWEERDLAKSNDLKRPDSAKSNELKRPCKAPSSLLYVPPHARNVETKVVGPFADTNRSGMLMTSTSYEYPPRFRHQSATELPVRNDDKKQLKAKAMEFGDERQFRTVPFSKTPGTLSSENPFELLATTDDLQSSITQIVSGMSSKRQINQSLISSEERSDLSQRTKESSSDNKRSNESVDDRNKDDSNKENEEEWQQVTKKGRKLKQESPTVNQTLKTPVTVNFGVDKEKKTNNFEKLINRMMEIYGSLSRNEIIDVIATVRADRGGLSGLTMKEIVEEARLVILRNVTKRKEKHAEQLHSASHTTVLKNSPEVSSHMTFLKNNPELTKLQAIMEHPTNKYIKHTLSMQGDTLGMQGEQCNDEDICVICHDGLRLEENKKLDCGHIFHAGCIKQWVYGREMTCPTCRRLVLFPEEFPILGR